MSTPGNISFPLKGSKPMAQIRYDEKGKFFTNFVTKNTVQAIIQTTHYRIRGEIHVRVGDRVKDELNRPDQFLAVTNAAIYDDTDTLLFRREFVSINRDHIIWVIPEKETGGEFGASDKAEHASNEETSSTQDSGDDV